MDKCKFYPDPNIQFSICGMSLSDEWLDQCAEDLVVNRFFSFLIAVNQLYYVQQFREHIAAGTSEAP